SETAYSSSLIMTIRHSSPGGVTHLPEASVIIARRGQPRSRAGSDVRNRAVSDVRTRDMTECRTRE
ncbi:MAG: hypothetical protein QOK15_1344, partial [Nocardioidaceae bacterium]|nr:hypothetical protein [Nocardioidaceae bacterium]